MKVDSQVTSRKSPKTCFVISPIGKSDSVVRQLADDLLDLVIAPALEKYGFSVVRADKIPKPGIITSEIVHLVQNSELCIIDLTGHNANVFYECGRRHETGKPFIQVIRKGEELPFDVSGIRTIFYDVSTARATKESIESIRKYVDEFEASGYVAASSGVSLSTIAQAIERMERQMGRIFSGPSMRSPSTPLTQSEILDPFLSLRNPREAFMKAIAGSDLDGAIYLLPKLRELLGPTEEFISAAGFIAMAGQEVGALAIRDILEQNNEDLSIDGIKAGLAALVQYYTTTDKEAEALKVLPELCNRLLVGRNVQGADKAFMLNQMQKVYYGAKEYESALEGARQAVELMPDSVSYKFNLSLIYEQLGQKKEALKLVDQYMSLQEVDNDHLMHAIETYVDANRLIEAKSAFSRLVQNDQAAAKLLLLRGGASLRKAVQA